MGLGLCEADKKGNTRTEPFSNTKIQKVIDSRWEHPEKIIY